MQTQTILLADGMIYHPAPFRWFPCIQRRLNLVQAGKGARNVPDDKLTELRATPIDNRKRDNTPCPRGDKLATVVWNICVEGDEQNWVSGLPPDARQRLDKAVNDYCV